MLNINGWTEVTETKENIYGKDRRSFEKDGKFVTYRASVCEEEITTELNKE